MAQMDLTVDTLPPGAFAYQYCIIDAPGVVAANNFFSVMNPAGNTKNIALLAVSISSYATGSSSAAASMTAYRTTAASGGTLVLAANITKYSTAEPNATAVVRTGNPSVTLLTGSIPLLTIPPPFSTGAGNNNTGFSTPAGGALALAAPGEGLVFSTASGNTNQMWGIQLGWAEF